MKNTGGILLAGGSGTRLFPNTLTTNKHLLPIYDKPMIFYSLSILMLAGSKNITLVCNEKDIEDFNNILGSGEMLGININYSIQDSPKGIPDAINSALKVEKFDEFFVVLGDNFIYGSEFFSTLNIFINENNFGICTQKVSDPKGFGVVKYNKNGDVEKIIEKSDEFISNQAVIGLYKFDEYFSDYLNKITPSARGEYEIVDLINQYEITSDNILKLGRGTAWFDMGTSESFYNCSSFVKTIQERQGILVCSPHEIAFRKGYIDSNTLSKYIEKIKGSEYSENLLEVINEF